MIYFVNFLRTCNFSTFHIGAPFKISSRHVRVSLSMKREPEFCFASIEQYKEVLCGRRHFLIFNVSKKDNNFEAVANIKYL